MHMILTTYNGSITIDQYFDFPSYLISDMRIQIIMKDIYEYLRETEKEKDRSNIKVYFPSIKTENNIVYTKEEKQERDV